MNTTNSQRQKIQSHKLNIREKLKNTLFIGVDKKMNSEEHENAQDDKKQNSIKTIQQQNDSKNLLKESNNNNSVQMQNSTQTQEQEQDQELKKCKTAPYKDTGIVENIEDPNCESPSKNPKINHTIEDFFERYQIEKILGQGCHAVVKICRNLKNNKQFAVKIIRNGDIEIISAIIRSFKILKSLQHENIIKPYELFINQETENIFFVMEYCPYQSLSDILYKHKALPMPAQSSKNILKSLISTLLYLHQQGICHRDLKPDNILVSENYEKVKIIDFEVSKKFKIPKSMGQKSSLFSQEMWTRTGTLDYQAPEVFISAGYTESVDIWSLGVIAFQMFTGSLPFQSEFVSDTIEMITEGVLNEEKMSSLDMTRKDFLRRILKKKPRDRLTAYEALIHPYFILEYDKKYQKQEAFCRYGSDLKMFASHIVEDLQKIKERQNKGANGTISQFVQKLVTEDEEVGFVRKCRVQQIQEFKRKMLEYGEIKQSNIYIKKKSSFNTVSKLRLKLLQQKIEKSSSEKQNINEQKEDQWKNQNRAKRLSEDFTSNCIFQKEIEESQKGPCGEKNDKLKNFFGALKSENQGNTQFLNMEQGHFKQKGKFSIRKVDSNDFQECGSNGKLSSNKNGSSKNSNGNVFQFSKEVVVDLTE